MGARTCASASIALPSGRTVANIEVTYRYFGGTASVDVALFGVQLGAVLLPSSTNITKTFPAGGDDFYFAMVDIPITGLTTAPRTDYRLRLCTSAQIYINGAVIELA